MKIRQVGSVLGAQEARQHLTTFLINDVVAIDAGSLGLMAPLSDQRRVRHVLLSHSHIDHLATLPLFLDNVFQPGGDCPTIYAGDDVWQTLRQHVFNERLWPDLSRIAAEESPFFAEVALVSEVPVQIAGVTITPVAVNHAVPTLGFLVEDATSAAIIASDTGPTARIWELARRQPFRDKLRAVFLECSFPNRLEWLAEKSLHLSPRQFAEEIAKLDCDGSFQTVAVHLKAPLFDEVQTELAALRLPNFTLGGHDRTWTF